MPGPKPRGTGGGTHELHESTPAALIRHVETLKVPAGRRAGQPFKLAPWQRRFLRGAFAPGVATAAVTVGRGAGKSTLMAAVATAHLDGPLAVPRGEVVVAASSFQQSRIIHELVVALMGSRLRDKRFRVWDTAQQARVEDKHNGCRIRCVGSDPRRAHGLQPTLVLCDEGAQWPGTTGEAMLSALRTSLGKQPGSRLICIGTRPASGDHWFAKMLAGGADFTQTHAARDGDPPFHRRTWNKANPALKDDPDLEAAIRAEAKLAKRDPSALAAFKSLRLNMGVPDTEEACLLDASVWSRIEGDAPVRGACVWGVDLSTSDAMSAVAAYWPVSGRLEVVAAFAGKPSLAERGLRDGVGGLYAECHRRGELILAGEHAVDVGGLLREALDRFGQPSAIASDRWREAELRDALKAAGVPLAALELRGMGFRDGAADVRDFRRAVGEGRVTPLSSLLLTSAMAEARTVTDPAGNAKLAKSTEGGRRRRAKDDAAAAAVLAVALGSRRKGRGGEPTAYLGMTA